MNLPVRKCYYTVKIGIFLVIVVTLLSCFERWRGGRRAARAHYLSPEEEEYERQILEDEARIVPGLGEGGVAAHLVGEAKRLGEESEKELAINVYLSDRIAYNRTLKDYRNPACQRVLYDAELPSASVILIFHNEPYSVVVRTIWSVINSARRDQPWYNKANYVERETGRIMTLGYPGQDPNSKFVYLKEIILVDDNSTLPELKGKLSHYIRTRLPPDLVRVIRLPDRVGLTQARLAGARFAVGEVLVFLDSHCEAQRDWLRPLLQRIKESSHAVVVPIIDVIEASNFYYSVQEPATFQVGGFLFTGHFTWVDVPAREKKRRGSDIAPTWSPTMAGGLFAMDRSYFWQLGAYDEQMAGWGGENLEMSFRVWQCGGTLETIPCSRVGHVFRSFHPYGLPAHTDTHGINTARMAEVWMDDYAELFYLHRPDLRNNPSIGDVTHRRVLRDKLRCKSFQWYLDNIYKEKFVPVRDVYGYGRIRNPATGLCLDTMQREGEASPLGLYPCHARLQATQYLALSAAGELRDEEKCAELQYTRRKADEDEEGRQVLMISCHGKKRGQRWRYLPSKQLKHVESGLCLSARGAVGGGAGGGAGADAAARRCSDTDLQRWDIDYSEDNDFGVANHVELSDQELRLQRLRGRRRISRSLLSRDSLRRSHHKHRKPRKKNKFILKLVRSLDNNTQEHVEADIYCTHTRLYPNNSFVRDLVTILNDRDIKVINNGRVFEKNRVSELVKQRDTVREVKVLEKLELPRNSAVERAEPKHWEAKKHKPEPELVPPYSPGGRVGDIRPGGADTLLRNAGDTDVDKKIIIEDFVEIKPAVTTVPPKKSQHKHKHGRGRSPLKVKNVVRVVPPRPQNQLQWEKPKPVESPNSLEDSPMLGSGELLERVQASREHYRQGSISYRKEATTPHTHAREHAHTHTRVHAHTRDSQAREDNSADPDTYDSAARSNPPVKLVMRSNLTFKLGDEFFNWNHSADDVANLLGELTIPVNTPTVHSTHAAPGGEHKRSEDSERGSSAARDSADDALLTGRGLPHRENTAAKEVELSGSSESASSDS